MELVEKRRYSRTERRPDGILFLDGTHFLRTCTTASGPCAYVWYATGFSPMKKELQKFAQMFVGSRYLKVIGNIFEYS